MAKQAKKKASGRSKSPASARVKPASAGTAPRSRRSGQPTEYFKNSSGQWIACVWRESDGMYHCHKIDESELPHTGR